MMINSPPNQANSIRQLSLRLVLIIPFVVQVVSAVGLVGFLSYRSGQQAVEKLADKLMTQTSNRIEQHLNSYLGQAQKINRINVDAFESDVLDLHNFNALGKYFYHQMKTFGFSYVNFAAADGAFIGAGYGKDNEFEIRETLSSNLPTHFVYSVDYQGNRVKLINAVKKSVAIFSKTPVFADWYHDAVKAGKPIWSSIYTWGELQNHISIAASYPIHNQEKKLLGVLGIELDLSLLSNFLKNLSNAQSEHIFIVEPSGLMIASSEKELPVPMVNGKISRLNAINSRIPIIRKVAQQLDGLLEKNQIQLLRPNIGQRPFTMSQHPLFDIGQHPFVRVIPYRDAFGLDWRVVIVVPEAEFMTEIQANTRATVLLCLLTLVIAICLGIITSGLIANPIRRLSRASIAIAGGELNQVVKIEGITELKTLANSFNQMADQLQDSFENLEHKVQQRTLELSNTLSELQATQKQLVESEKMAALGTLVAGVAHEINNPVNFVHFATYTLKVVIDKQKQFLLSLLEEEPEILAILQPQYQQLASALENMEDGCQRIGNIVSDLRTFSRLDEADRKIVDLIESLEATIRITQTQYKKNIRIDTDFQARPKLECWPAKLNQVFMNIIVNSCHAIEKKQETNTALLGLLTISSFEQEQAGGKELAICFCDNGCGMNKETINKMFEPFFTTKPVGQGTGLGMSISYGIIQEHNGRIAVKSESGQGTMITVYLPIHTTSMRKPTWN